MKKYLVSLAFVFIVITTFGQNSIPNGNFETWISGTYDCPLNDTFTSNSQVFFKQNTFNVTKTTPAYHGNYAVQLITSAANGDTSAGVFLNINPGNENGNLNAFTGGMPFNQKPTGIRGWYKYNGTTADSATIIVIFSKSGSNIGTYLLKIGGMHTSYTLFNFTFNPALSVIPDSIIFGAASSNVFVYKNGVAGSILVLDSVSFTGVSSQPTLMNGDFESWQSQTINTPVNWLVQDGNANGILRTTDAVESNYALELKTFLGNQHVDPASQMTLIQNGYYDNFCSCMRGGFPFSNQMDTLAFYYKYLPATTSDSAEINYIFKKDGNVISNSNVFLNATSDTSYQYEKIPIYLMQVPDTVIISIQPSSWTDTLVSSVGSDLKIDELHFKSQPLNTNVFNYKNNNTISVFPNPASDIITITNLNAIKQNYVVSIKNIEGQEVLSKEINFITTYSINVGALSNGVYILSLQNDKENYVRKIIIQK